MHPSCRRMSGLWSAAAEQVTLMSGLSELDAALLQYRQLTFSVSHTQYSKVVILSHASQSATSEPREMEILSYLCHHTDVM